MLRITQNVTQKLVSNLKDAFDIFYVHRVAEYPIKEPFPYFLASKLLPKNCLSKLHHFQISFQYNFTTKQSILDMTV